MKWLALVLLGCGGTSAAVSSSHTVDVAAVEASPPIPQAPEVHACEHAIRCCREYIRTMTAPAGAALDPAQACAGIEAVRGHDAATDACKQMMTAWREALESANMAVPGACGGDVE